MKINSQFTSIHPDTILFEDDTYDLCPFVSGKADKVLADSIHRFGILHPPIVQQTADKHHIIVTGRKRIQAFLNQGYNDEHIPCRCLSSGTPESEIYSILLEDSLTRRQLSVVEQAVYLQKARAKSTNEELLTMLSRLGHKPHQHIVDNLLELLSLHRDAIRALHEGTLQQNNARKLLKLSESDQKILIERITHLHLGGSKQKKLIELCTELIMRNKESADSIMNRFDLHSKMGGDENMPQQASALLIWLNRECFPNLSEAKLNFERLVSQLNLPPQCRVHPSKSFEDDTVVLSINFASFNSMQDILPEIIRVSSGKASDS